MKIKILSLLLFHTTVEVLTVGSVYTDNISIPENAIEFNGHIYKYYTESIDWYSAKEMCEKYGGHLVTITSVEENDFLIDNLPNYNKSFYWIGLTDEKQEGMWHWVTNETFSFCNWSENSPNNNAYKEHYAGFMSKEENYDGYPTPIGSWNDYEVSPSDEGGYICEWDFIEENNNDQKNTTKEYITNNNSQQTKEDVNNEQENSDNSNIKLNNSQNPNNSEEKVNKAISIIFNVDSLSIFGGVSIFGEISILGGNKLFGSNDKKEN